MRRRSSAAAALVYVLAGLATAAHGQEIGVPGAASLYGPDGSKVLTLPNDAEVAAAWPVGKAGEGSAVAHCRATAAGVLDGCALTLERGSDAGAALLKLAPKYRIQLPTGVPEAEVVISGTWPVADRGPDWAVPPKPGDFMTTATDAAWKSGMGGFAVMNCLEGKLGTLYRCVVVYQDPPGKGYGTMLLRFAAYLRLKPALKAGEPISSGVNIPFHFEKAPPGAQY